MEKANPFAADGYEGTMLRNGAAVYKFAHRSSDLLKVKNSMEQEFEIVGVTEKINYEKPLVAEGTPGAQRHTNGTFYLNGNPRPAGVVGAISCVTATGEHFDVGSGLSDAERKHYWENRPIGKLCTVRFQELSLRSIPRFPTFRAVRDYE